MLGPSLDGAPTVAGRRLTAGWWTRTVAGTGTVVPDGAADVMWATGSLPWLAAPDTAPRRPALRPGTVVVGVRLAPGATPGVLGDRVDTATDQLLPIDRIWPRPLVEELVEGIGASGEPGDIARLIEMAVERVGAEWQPDPLVVSAMAALRRGGPIDRGSIGERQFRRRFTSSVGYGPALYRRVARLDRLTDLLDLYPSRHLGELAAAAGYYDESHLWRDATELLGRTPGSLRP